MTMQDCCAAAALEAVTTVLLAGHRLIAVAGKGTRLCPSGSTLAACCTTVPLTIKYCRFKMSVVARSLARFATRSASRGMDGVPFGGSFGEAPCCSNAVLWQHLAAGYVVTLLINNALIDANSRSFAFCFARMTLSGHAAGVSAALETT